MSFYDVNTNNASSGLRKHVILTNFWCKIMVGKFGTNIDVEGMGEGRHSWEDHTYQADMCVPHDFLLDLRKHC